MKASAFSDPAAVVSVEEVSVEEAEEEGDVDRISPDAS